MEVCLLEIQLDELYLLEGKESKVVDFATLAIEPKSGLDASIEKALVTEYLRAFRDSYKACRELVEYDEFITEITAFHGDQLEKITTDAELYEVLDIDKEVSGLLLKKEELKKLASQVIREG